VISASGATPHLAAELIGDSKRKHHFLFAATPVSSSRTTTLSRTIDWQGQTYDIGARVEASVKSLIFSPGYEYDFFRCKAGYLGVLVNANLAYTDAKLKASINWGHGTESDGSLFAPLPAVGPTFRCIRFLTLVGFTLTERSPGCLSLATAISFQGTRYWDSQSHPIGLYGLATWLEVA
jgi:hypothetical protein